MTLPTACISGFPVYVLPKKDRINFLFGVHAQVFHEINTKQKAGVIDAYPSIALQSNISLTNIRFQIVFLQTY